MMKQSTMAIFRSYLKLRRLGIRDAWQISGMSDIGDKLVGYTCVICAIAVAAYFVFDYKSGYTKELEKILALCLDDTYHPVKIGDDLFMCGIDKI